VSSTVVLLGLTSLFTDISSEMVNAVLPLYLTLQLGFSPLQFGLVDGFYHGITALARIQGGLVADRHGRYKEVAGAGYALSAACKVGLWSAGSGWAPTVGFLFLDRFGKGIRTPPRDALISLSTPTASLGEAFGVHRALDTVGALLGPILAFGLLALIPGAYDAIFVTSFFVALIGLGVLLFFVSNAVGGPSFSRDPVRPMVSLGSIVSLIRLPRFKAVLVAAVVLSIATVSDSFVYLILQRTAQIPPSFFPLLYVGTSLVYLLLAVPAGKLADRLGRSTLFLGGHGLLLGLYVVMLWPHLGSIGLILSLLLLGAYYAATDGVIMAIASAALPASHRTTGLALLTTLAALSRLVGSSLFGALWAWYGPWWSFTAFLVGLLAAATFASAMLARAKRMETT